MILIKFIIYKRLLFHYKKSVYIKQLIKIQKVKYLDFLEV